MGHGSTICQLRTSHFKLSKFTGRLLVMTCFNLTASDQILTTVTSRVRQGKSNDVFVIRMYIGAQERVHTVFIPVLLPNLVITKPCRSGVSNRKGGSTCHSQLELGPNLYGKRTSKLCRGRPAEILLSRSSTKITSLV